MGSGIGSLDDVYETTIAYEKGVCELFTGMLHRLTLAGLSESLTPLRPSTVDQFSGWSCLHALWL